MARRVAAARERLAALELELADPEVARTPPRLRELGVERAGLAEIISSGREVESLERELAEAQEILDESPDPEMAALAEEEIASLGEALKAASGRLRAALIPPDPMEDRPAVVEIRAGTGGDEAGLFASDLYRMYTRYAQRNGWQTEVIDVKQPIVRK